MMNEVIFMGECMKRFAVIGMQWGDEGKGKMTDVLAKNADIVIRYQGGDNAGHTVVFDDQKIDLHLLPSGVIHDHTINIMAHGMVINLMTLFEELKKFPKATLYISDRAHIILPFHKTLDAQKERTQHIGTTKKGIGPTYADKILRQGLRVASLFTKNRFVKDAKALAKNHGFDFDAASFYDNLKEEIEALKPKIKHVPTLLKSYVESNKKMIFEGAQGVMLDIDHGTYPYVTSSSPSVSGISQQAGIPPWYIDGSIGIIKAYSTRVGEGPFPTEMKEDKASVIREVAKEYGTTTGRPRRIGYLDLVALKHAVMSSGMTHIAVTILDVMNELDVIKVCDYYVLNGEKVTSLPAHIDDLYDVKPHYIEMPSFKEDISACQTYESLPKEAKAYVEFIASSLDATLAYVSVGPDRTQTIECVNVWEASHD